MFQVLSVPSSPTPTFPGQLLLLAWLAVNTCSFLLKLFEKVEIVSRLLYNIQKFGFINGVDNVNWPPYRDSKS